MTVPERIKSLRQLMNLAGVSAYIINSSDPHGSEFPAERWRTREWISGFTGSAGIVVVTEENVGLWTDFRYWIQASLELSGSGITLFEAGKQGVPGIPEWLSEHIPPESTVAFDGRVVLAQTAGEWEEKINQCRIRIDSSVDFIGSLWTNRPETALSPVIFLNENETGESRLSKIHRLKKALFEEKADSWIGIGLEAIAWLLNIRGSDVPFNPVVYGFIVYVNDEITWFTDEKRIASSWKKTLSHDRIRIKGYNAFFSTLEQISCNSRILIDPQCITRGVLDHLPTTVAKITAADPVIMMKARKNSVEAARIARAMEKDGVAVVRFLMKLEKAISRGEILTEHDAAAMLLGERASLPGFLEESFSPIVAYDSHGALCHYEATPQGSFTLEAGPHLLLLDSGGQWTDGTTDLTRTIALGVPEQQHIRDYTLTLKGHLALSMARFPRGTRGYQLDTLARSPLWQEGMNFGHGTGHGVGYRLNVHEGPQKINPDPVDVPLEPGMVVSNEPGVYRENCYGIRIENILICREDITNDFASFLAFDTLTLAPYDRRLIDICLLNEKEREWINHYHAEVFRRLSSMLTEEEHNWLETATAALKR